MHQPFPLPEGLALRELTEDDKRWLGARNDYAKFAALSITVTIRHPDGRERQYTDGWYPFDPFKNPRDLSRYGSKIEALDGLLEGILFQWTEGNYGCDCNRARFFARAAEEDDPDVPCGDTYRVVSPAWLRDP
jgi:hypothetical protein